jgi:hypothetical protein
MGNVHWTGTLHLNVVRIASASATIVILFILGRVFGFIDPGAFGATPLLNVVAAPLIVLGVGSVTVLVGRALTAIGLPFAGLLTALIAIAMTAIVAIGDPLIWVGRKFYPALIPSVRFNPLNLHAVMMVEKE